MMVHHNRLNAYHIMWLFVFFDLPTQTPKERKEYAKFRKGLLNDGFSMMQYSVYTRHTASRESAEVHAKRVKKIMPPAGQVSVMMITDKQFGMIHHFWGVKRKPAPDTPKQFELF